MRKGKTVLLGVTGSIAAYKMPYVASALKKQGVQVHVLMTPNAVNFINPITFETITGTKCLVDTFDRNFEYSVEHVSLAKQADACLIAPASANVIAKLSHGLADDMLTTTVLACRCPKLVAPAMNTGMYENPVTQDNIQKLKRYGMTVIDPAVGYLACGDTGAGKMPEPEVLLDYLYQEILCEKDMQGLKVLVTAGPTQEAIDPVRYITNHSTGKMGYALARMASRRGAQVTLITGKTELPPPRFVHTVPVVSAQEMLEAVQEHSACQDIIIKAAAVADYRPAQVQPDKIKKGEGESSIPLVRTADILQYLGDHRAEGQFLCGFSMETKDMLENTQRKLEKKHVDMMVANNLKVAGAGFGTDTNVVTIVTKEAITELSMMTKEKVSEKILDEILRLRSRRDER